MSVVSGSLDEEDRPDVRKGYEIALVDNRLRLSLTDGFKLNFQFSLFDLSATEDELTRQLYGLAAGDILVASFVLDGGPKVASCVVNGRLYNSWPAGWRFLPREMGEVGGADVTVRTVTVTCSVVNI